MNPSLYERVNYTMPHLINKKKTLLISLFILLSSDFSTTKLSSFVSTIHNKHIENFESKTPEDIKEKDLSLANCTLHDIDILNYLYKTGDLCDTISYENFLTTQQKDFCDSLDIGRGIQTVSLYNQQFKQQRITHSETFIKQLGVLGVEKSDAPRLHRILNDRCYKQTDNGIIPIIRPKHYEALIKTTGYLTNYEYCMFNEIITPQLLVANTKKKISKGRLTPKKDEYISETIALHQIQKNHLGHKQAKALLNNAGISLRSSKNHHHENGESYEHGNTCIEGIHGLTVLFIESLSQEILSDPLSDGSQIWLTGCTERGHAGEKTTIIGKTKYGDIKNHKKEHGSGYTGDIACDGINSLLIMKYFPVKSYTSSFNFKGFKGKYSRHTSSGNKYKQNHKKGISSSFHLHFTVLEGPKTTK